MTAPLQLPLRAGLPPLQRVVIQCPTCNLTVRVLVVRDFLALLRRLSALAGVPLARDLPMQVSRCDRGHIVVLPLATLELAS